jgi:DNA-binding NarL/FixJ family response regulator
MPGIQIRGLATRGTDGVERAALIKPDVVLVDAELPHDAALTTIRQLRACLPTARIVALGFYPDRHASMLAAGAHAFVLKDAGFEAIRAAIVLGAAAEHADPENCGEPHARTSSDECAGPHAQTCVVDCGGLDVDIVTIDCDGAPAHTTVDCDSASARTHGSVLR